MILRIRGRFPDGFSATFAGLRRVGAGMVPGYAVGLRYFFSGVPLGYGDLAKRFKFAVPHRGAWRGSEFEHRSGPVSFRTRKVYLPPPSGDRRETAGRSTQGGESDIFSGNISGRFFDTVIY